MKKNAWVLLLFIVIMITASVTHGALAPPPDLFPGDTFHWAFVTQDSTQATSGDISDYNTFVNDQAELDDALTKGLEINWYAVGSTLEVDANNNVSVTGPVYLLDGTLIANNAIDLWDGTINNPIAKDQFDVTMNDTVWTGSSDDGSARGEHYLGGEYPATGRSDTTDSGWIFKSYHESDEQFHLYAISEIQTVVPISSAVWLLGSGLVCIVGIRRKFKK